MTRLGKVDRRVSYLRRQLDAALAAAGSQDGAAGTGAHTKAEAVLLGPTAVIRLKSPLAHVSYSSGSKVRPPDQKGKNWPTLSFLCIRSHPTPDLPKIQVAESGHIGLHNVRAKTRHRSNREGLNRLSPAVAKSHRQPVDEVAHRAVFRTTTM